MTMTRLMATTTAVMASAAARTPVVVTGMTITAATTTASVRVVATLTTPAPKQRHLPLTGTSRTIRYHPPSLPRLLLRLPDGLLNLLLRRLRLLLPITNIILFHLLPLNLLHSLLNELGGNAHRVVLRRQQQVPQLLCERRRILLQEWRQCDLDMLRIDRLRDAFHLQSHTSSKANML